MDVSQRIICSDDYNIYLFYKKGFFFLISEVHIFIPSGRYENLETLSKGDNPCGCSLNWNVQNGEMDVSQRIICSDDYNISR
jgi:hypothetical protein